MFIKCCVFDGQELFCRFHGYGEFFKGETLTSVSSIVYTSADAETHRRQKVNHRRIVKVGVNLDARYFSTSHMLFTLLMKIRAKPSRWKLGNVAKRCIT